jgi:hypothetical protein
MFNLSKPEPKRIEANDLLSAINRVSYRRRARRKEFFMAEIDIEKLTKDIRAGKGCALEPVLEKLGYPETLKLMVEMSQKARAEHNQNPSLPPLKLVVSSKEGPWLYPTQSATLDTGSTSRPMFSMSLGTGKRNLNQVQSQCYDNPQKY